MIGDKRYPFQAAILKFLFLKIISISHYFLSFFLKISIKRNKDICTYLCTKQK
ncbi:hypothetical protein IWX84_003087 [Flavobacterium sp. CG_9.10]|nr:hypothetical protein [Flavobacterium sp. CG_9.10]